MMPNARFLSKAFKKIGQLEKDSFENLTSELAKERALFAEILDTIQEGVVIIDTTNSQATFMNLSAKLILTGSSSLDYPYGPFSKLILDGTLKDLITDTIEEKSEIYDEPFEILLPRYVSVRLSIQKLWRINEKTGGKEALNGSYGILINPNTPKSREAREKSDLDKTFSILSLASGIAHELGNPLNSINIHLNLLSKEIDKLSSPNKSRLKKSVQVVLEETDRLDKIVRNFLKSTRRRPIHFEFIQIKDVIQDVLVLFKPQLKSKKIKTSEKFDPKMPKFFMDPERISLVFTNLIKNAIQAMPKGGKLTIATGLHKNSCVVTISDTGVGISKESLPKVFDAYYTTKEEGSGLGLVISYQIIREHGGRIEVKSDQGKGTSISVLLPIRAEKLSLPAPIEKENKNEQFI